MEQEMSTIGVCRTFFVLAKAALSKGFRNTKDAPGTVLFEVDQHYAVELNGHDEPCEGVPPMAAKVFFDGELCGIVMFFASKFAKHPVATEYDFVRACQRCYKTGKFEQFEFDFAGIHPPGFADGETVPLRQKDGAPSVQRGNLTGGVNNSKQEVAYANF